MAYLESLWHFLLLTAPFFLAGLLLSGLMFGLVSFDRLRRFIGGERISGVFKAAVIGVPLPLCSCSVIPAAVTLKKAKAGNGSTSAFLIATPETGADSVFMSYAMMDLPMTIIRPFAAFCSAIVAGIGQILFNPDPEAKALKLDREAQEAPFERKSFREMMRFSFVDLLDDIAFWLGIGILAGAGIALFVPSDFFVGHDSFLGRVLILLLCLPLYVCASATTPLVASMVMKGMSPGLGLLILLAGPAVNLSNILVLRKHLGTKAVVINIISISLVALGLSYGVDALYRLFDWPILFNLEQEFHEHGHSIIEKISAAIMGLLLLWSIGKTQVWVRLKGRGHYHHHHHDHHHDHDSCCK
jgi:uncharacterized protein